MIRIYFFIPILKCPDDLSENVVINIVIVIKSYLLAFLEFL